MRPKAAWITGKTIPVARWRAFATDAQARSVARHILALGFDRSYPADDHRVLCYLPFEHSEDIEDQKLAVQLLSERTADIRSTEYARRHLEIITRFGRFPPSECTPQPNLDFR